MGSETRDYCGIIRLILTPDEWGYLLCYPFFFLKYIYPSLLQLQRAWQVSHVPAHSSCAGRLDFCAIGSKNRMNIIIWGLQSRGSVISVDCIFYYIDALIYFLSSRSSKQVSTAPKDSKPGLVLFVLNALNTLCPIVVFYLNAYVLCFQCAIVIVFIGHVGWLFEWISRPFVDRDVECEDAVLLLAALTSPSHRGGNP